MCQVRVSRFKQRCNSCNLLTKWDEPPNKVCVLLEDPFPKSGCPKAENPFHPRLFKTA